MFQDSLDVLSVLNEADNPHDSPIFRTGGGIDLVDLLNQPGPILTVFLRTLIGFQDAEDPIVSGSFPLSPRDITVVPIVPGHLLLPVRDMGAHGGQPLQGVENLFLGSVFRKISLAGSKTRALEPKLKTHRSIPSKPGTWNVSSRLSSPFLFALRLACQISSPTQRAQGEEILPFTK